MKFLLHLALFMLVSAYLTSGKKVRHDVDFDDNEFAEFEEFDDDGNVYDMCFLTIMHRLFIQNFNS